MDIGELNTLGRRAAEAVAGTEAVRGVQVKAGQDYDERPAYHFSFWIDQSRTQKRPGLVLIRLLQKLRDDLDAQGDDHIPTVKIWNEEDWIRRTSAEPV